MKCWWHTPFGEPSDLKLVVRNASDPFRDYGVEDRGLCFRQLLSSKAIRSWRFDWKLHVLSVVRRR